MIQAPEDQRIVVRQLGRRSYHTPRLFVYGAVREFTMGGSKGSAENSSTSQGKGMYG
jgi:hypothetical protein